MIVTMYMIKEISPAYNRQQLQKDSNVLLSIGRFVDWRDLWCSELESMGSAR